MSEPTQDPPAPDAPKSPWRIVMGRLLRNRFALLGGMILGVLYLSAIFANFFSPYDPETSSDTTHHPPHHIRFVDQEGKFHLRPFIYRYAMTDLLRRAYGVDTSERYPIQFFVQGEPYRLLGLFETRRRLFGVGGGDQAGVRIYLLGSDWNGRDLFSRVLHGGRISLSIGLIGIMITMSLGMLVGGISGYFAGWVDLVMMRVVELLMSIPGLYLILALRAGLSGDSPFLHWLFRLEEGEHLGSGQIYLLIVAILGLVGWGGTARVIRGQVLAVKELDYVRAARSLGASHLRIIIRHLLPNTFTYVIVSATLAVPAYILGEVALSFLGVGIEEPTPSWGLMLHDGQTLHTLTSAPWILVPGVFIFVTVFAFNFLGDGLRDALDPKAVE